MRYVTTVCAALACVFASWMGSSGVTRRTAASELTSTTSAASPASDPSNLLLQASGDFIATITADDIDENDAHFKDNILETDITGTTHTVGSRGSVLVDCPDRVLMEVRMRGTTTSQTVGFHPPVTVRSTGTTQFTGALRVAMDADGFFASAPASWACTHTTINGICVCGGRLVQRIAPKRVYKSKPEAECVASQHAKQRVKDRIDSNAKEGLAAQNQNYQEKVRNPLEKLGAMPDMHYSSTPAALFISAREQGADSLAGIGSPPALNGNPLMGLRVHETFINNITAKTLGGRTLTRPQFEKAFKDLFGDLPPGTKDDGKEWTITFAKERPVTVRFADSGFSVAIHAMQFTSTNPDVEINEAWNIAAKYKIEGHKATRIGDIELVPPASAGQQLSSKQTGRKRVLHDRFGEFFKDVIEFQGIEFQKAPFSRVGKLVSSQMSFDQGWLTVGWNK